MTREKVDSLHTQLDTFDTIILELVTIAADIPHAPSSAEMITVVSSLIVHSRQMRRDLQLLEKITGDV